MIKIQSIENPGKLTFSVENPERITFTMEIPGASLLNWILSQGSWNDNGVWIDNETWKDN